MIPKIVHQVWTTEHIPKDVYIPRWLDSWKHFCPEPEWQHILWTNKKSRAFLSEYYSWFLPIFDGFDWDIKRADAIRYFVLYHYGGVYADLDIELLRNIDDIMVMDDAVFALECETNLVANAIMFSKPGLDFWHRVFNKMICLKDLITVMATGPTMLSITLNDVGQPYTILPPDTFHPLIRGEARMGGKIGCYKKAYEKNAYGIHWVKSLWANHDGDIWSDSHRFQSLHNAITWEPDLANKQFTRKALLERLYGAHKNNG